MRDVVREITKMGRTRLIHVNTGGGRRAAGGGVRGAGCGVRGAGIRRSTTNAMAGLLVVPPPAARRPPPAARHFVHTFVDEPPRPTRFPPTCPPPLPSPVSPAFAPSCW